MNNGTKKGLLLILLSTIMFASYGVWSKLIGNSFGVFYQGWVRGLILSIILFPILYYTKQIVPIKKADWRWLIIFLIATSLTQAPLFYAFNHVDIGTGNLPKKGRSERKLYIPKSGYTTIVCFSVVSF